MKQTWGMNVLCFYVGKPCPMIQLYATVVSNINVAYARLSWQGLVWLGRV